MCSLLAAVAFVCLYVWLPETAGQAYRLRVAAETAGDVGAAEDGTTSNDDRRQDREGRRQQQRQWWYGQGSRFTKVSTESESEHGIGLQLQESITSTTMTMTTTSSSSSNIDDDDDDDNHRNNDDGEGNVGDDCASSLPSPAVSDIEDGNNNDPNNDNDDNKVKLDSSEKAEQKPSSIATISTKSGSSDGDDAGSSDKSVARARPATLLAMLLDPQLSLLSMVYTGFCFAVMFIDEAFPLWAVSSLDKVCEDAPPPPIIFTTVQS